MSKKLQDALKSLGKRGVDTFPAKVVSVNKEKGTIVINDGELEYTDVALSATVEDGGKRFFLFPKVESYVLVSPVQEDIHRLYVEFFSEVEELDFRTEETQLKVNDEGFLLKKENETLKKLMEDLITAIRNMVFQTNSGITIQLLTDPQFEALKTRFNNFLKDN